MTEMRICAGCHESKPLTTEFFHANGIGANGQQRFKWRCRPCATIRSREWRASLPPDAHARWLEDRRMWRTLDNERKGRPLAIAGETRNGGNGRGERRDSRAFPDLPAAPLVKAIHRLIAAEQAGQFVKGPRLRITLEGGGPMPEVGVREAVCTRLGIAMRALREWEVGRRRSVRFDVADKVVGRSPWLWFDVWQPCNGDAQHLRDVTALGECPRCEAYCAAEDAFTAGEQIAA